MHGVGAEAEGALPEQSEEDQQWGLHIGDVVQIVQGRSKKFTYALYCGRGRVIHVWSPSRRNFRVRVDSLRGLKSSGRSRRRIGSPLTWDFVRPDPENPEADESHLDSPVRPTKPGTESNNRVPASRFLRKCWRPSHERVAWNSLSDYFQDSQVRSNWYSIYVPPAILRLPSLFLQYDIQLALFRVRYDVARSLSHRLAGIAWSAVMLLKCQHYICDPCLGLLPRSECPYCRGPIRYAQPVRELPSGKCLRKYSPEHPLFDAGTLLWATKYYQEPEYDCIAVLQVDGATGRSRCEPTHSDPIPCRLANCDVSFQSVAAYEEHYEIETHDAFFKICPRRSRLHQYPESFSFHQHRKQKGEGKAGKGAAGVKHIEGGEQSEVDAETIKKRQARKRRRQQKKKKLLEQAKLRDSDMQVDEETKTHNSGEQANNEDSSILLKREQPEVLEETRGHLSPHDIRFEDEAEMIATG
ncbi:Zinc finger, RING-type, conserved site [Phytophthora cactorum]|nr:Zinc finger, RING-type, conserved site [Phytophthora cactorum]